MSVNACLCSRPCASLYFGLFWISIGVLTRPRLVSTSVNHGLSLGRCLQLFWPEIYIDTKMPCAAPARPAPPCPALGLLCSCPQTAAHTNLGVKGCVQDLGVATDCRILPLSKTVSLDGLTCVVVPGLMRPLQLPCLRYRVTFCHQPSVALPGGT